MYRRTVARPRVRRTLLALPALAAVGILSATTVSAEPTGPDVSSWQHIDGRMINWFEVKAAGNHFAMVKATEGLNYVNPYFVPDSVLMRAAGV
ncbi:GH25 family lysozyme, partial [Nocardia wallacei]